MTYTNRPVAGIIGRMNTQPISSATTHLNTLKAFRQAAYQGWGNARDALWELSDAVLVTPAPPSFAHLSLAPVFRRRWPSVYVTFERWNVRTFER